MHRSHEKYSFRVRCLTALALLLAGSSAADPRLDGVFDGDVLIVAANEYACYRFDIYLATNDMQRAQGLMFVRNLPATAGMLFIYEEDAFLSMWMKNTYIPLDMLFIRADGTIANIAKDTVPLSLDSVSAIEPLNFVLELNAGVTDRLRIDTDSRVIFSTP